MEKVNKLLERFYFILKELFGDDDKIFGSRQLYLFSITITSYIYIPFLLIMRLFLPQSMMSELKSIILFFVVLVFFLILFLTFYKYSKLKSNGILYSNFQQKVIYFFLFFFPYIIIILLFYK
jgi:hypothetical protein